MSQSKSESIKEACVNIAFGLVVAWVITYSANHWIMNTATAATVSVFGCTVWSFVRQYFVRRWFNSRTAK